MIEDLPAPELIPANTQLKTERINMTFDDVGGAYVEIITAKGYTDAAGFHADAATRVRTVCDSIPVTPDMGPKQIIAATKAEIAGRKQKEERDAILLGIQPKGK